MLVATPDLAGEELADMHPFGGSASGARTRAFWAIVECFLARELGGRTEPWSDELAGSSVEVRAGVELVPGLAEALGARSTR